MEKEKKEKKWHKYTVTCPKCSKAIAITTLAFISSGDIRITGLCRHCKIEIFCEMEIMAIMTSCARNEKEGRRVMMKKTTESKNWVN